MTPNRFSARRTLSIAKKEVKHVLRDPFTLAVALGIPILLVVFFGFVIDFNYRDLRLSLSDRDQTRASRELSSIFSSSGYFLVEPSRTASGDISPLASNAASGILIVESGFGKDLQEGRPVKVQMLIDGSDNSKAGVILSYLQGIFDKANEKLSGQKIIPPIAVRTRFLFNPELNSRWFTVPGLVVVILGLLSILLTSLTVAREWENGSMELLLSTPVQPLEIIVGKLLPYAGLAFASVFFVYSVARIVFQIPFAGSLFVFLPACAFFVLATLAQGLLISVLTRQQQIAMQLSIISGLLPSLLLSGFIFPIESMPVFFQYFTGILSQRWFMEITRGVFLKGSGLMDILKPFSALVVIALLLVLISTKKFKRDLEP